MRLTNRAFSRLYQIYKDDFDFEMRLQANNCTYAEAQERAQRAQEWL